jgi:hypothetical protein
VPGHLWLCRLQHERSTLAGAPRARRASLSVTASGSLPGWLISTRAHRHHPAMMARRRGMTGKYFPTTNKHKPLINETKSIADWHHNFIKKLV